MLIKTKKGGWNNSQGIKRIMFLKIKLMIKLKVLNCDINNNYQIMIRPVHE
jgi:hypothetical protein